MKLSNKVKLNELMMHIADMQLACSQKDPMEDYEKGVWDGLEKAYDAIQEWADRNLNEEVYMEIYKHGREDEAGLRDGKILQIFCPD